MKRCLAYLLLLSLLPILSGCSEPELLKADALNSLPPAIIPYEAPLGTEDMHYRTDLP